MKTTYSLYQYNFTLLLSFAFEIPYTLIITYMTNVYAISA